jgi:O-antigen ligase
MYIQSKFLKAVRLTNLYSILLLVVSLSISFSIFQRIAFLIALFSYVIELILEKKWRELKWENTARQWFFVTIIIYFLLQFFYFPFETNTNYFQPIFEERVAFLVFGIVGLIGFNKYFKLKYFAWAFIATSFVLGVFLLSKLNAEILNSPNRNDMIAFIRIKYISSHMKFNYFLNISLIFMYYLVAVYKIKKSFLNTFALIISFLVIILNLFLSDGRIGLMTSFIILALYILRYLWSKSIRLTIISTSVFLLLVFVLIQQNPRLNSEHIKREPRKEIWKVAVDEIKESHFLGEGASTASYNLALEFSKRNMENFKHSHNIFLQTLVEYGIVGFLVILTMFLLSYFTVSKKFRFMIFLFTMATILQLLVGSFQMDLNPMVFLLTIALIIHQDVFETKADLSIS